MLFRSALIASVVAGVAVQLLLRRWPLITEAAPDPSPARPLGLAPEPDAPIDPEAGPVMVTVEYLIDPARSPAFLEVMQQTRQARLRQGALSWGLFQDAAEPGRYVEYFLDETWVEHLRRHERFTAGDIGLRDQRLAFHRGDEPPRVRRHLAAQLPH